MSPRLGPLRSAVGAVAAACALLCGCATRADPDPSASSSSSSTPATGAPTDAPSAPPASASASASSAPPPGDDAPGPTDAARAAKLVADTPLVRRELTENPALRIVHQDLKLPPPLAWHRFSIQPAEPDPGVSYLRVRVSAKTGEVAAESMCDRGGWVSAGRRDFEERAVDALFALPEFTGLDRELREVSRGTVRMTVRVESCASTPADRTLSLYVGERHDTHTVRAFTVVAEDPGPRLSVAGLAGDLRPYAVWRTTDRAKDLATYGLPTDAGTGPLGYGAPNEITDGAKLPDALKAAVAGVLTLSRIEYYATNYPAFVGARAQTADVTFEEMDRVRKANADWPFELVWAEGRRRARWDGTLLRRFDGASWSALE